MQKDTVQRSTVPTSATHSSAFACCSGEDRALYVKKLAQSACIELDEREVKEIVSYFERLLPIFDSLQSQTDESAISAISQPARESSLRTDDAFVTSDPQPTLAAAARTKDGYFSTGPILN